MEDYLSEQDQVDALKKWLRANGPAIAIGLVVGLALIFGWRAWQAHERARAEAASAKFSEAFGLLRRGEAAQAEALAARLLVEYPDSRYAAFASLLLGALAVGKPDLAAAREHLRWVIEHSDDPHLVRVARMRLARVFLAEGRPQEAWEALAPLAAGGTPSAALAELKGDVLLAEGKAEEARREYLDAYRRRQGGGEASALALKLDALGGGAEAAPAEPK